MEKKHTLGPWTWENFGLDKWRLIGANGTVIISAKGEDGSEHDDRLIEAAPDLLEAVSIAYSHLTTPMSVQMSNEQLAEMMQDAIKKATE